MEPVACARVEIQANNSENTYLHRPRSYKRPTGVPFAVVEGEEALFFTLPVPEVEKECVTRYSAKGSWNLAARVDYMHSVDFRLYRRQSF